MEAKLSENGSETIGKWKRNYRKMEAAQICKALILAVLKRVKFSLRLISLISLISTAAAAVDTRGGLCFHLSRKSKNGLSFYRLELR